MTYCSTYSQRLHQMAVKGQFHSLDSVSWGKATQCPHSGRLDGAQRRSGCLGKRPMCCGYQNQTPYISASRINIVWLFMIIFVTDFKLTGFECEILYLNQEMYII